MPWTPLILSFSDDFNIKPVDVTFYPIFEFNPYYGSIKLLLVYLIIYDIPWNVH